MSRLASATPVVAALVLLAPAAAMAAAPSNDRWYYSTYLRPLPAVEATRTGEATLQQDEPRPCGNIGKTVWYTIQVKADQVITVNTSGSNFDTVLALYLRAPAGSGSGNEPALENLLGCNDDTAGTPQSKVRINAAAREEIYIQAGGYGGASGRLVVNVRTKPANDRLEQARDVFQVWDELETGGSHRELHTKKATLATGEPQPCAPIGRSVWWKADMSVFASLPPEDRTVYVDTADYGVTAQSDFDTVLAVYRLPDGLSPTFDNLVLIGCDDDSGPGSTSSLDLPFSVDDRLYFQVAGYDGAFGQLRFNVDVRPWVF